MAIACFNEAGTVATLIDRVLASPWCAEVVVVDDGSTDGTAKVLADLDEPRVRVITHDHNRGKGAALRSAFAHVGAAYVIVQDADLEYDPADYPVLLRPILSGRAKVVYGSRFLGPHRAMYFWHSVGNKLLTLLTNVLYDTTLTDMETCYKVFTADLLPGLRLRSDRWGFDPEITAKLLKRGHRIYEIPISYAGREFHEGKKITWKDGIAVFFTLLRYRVMD